MRVVPVIVTVATHSVRVVIRTMVVPERRQTFAYLNEIVTAVLDPVGSVMPTRDMADATEIRDAVDARVLV